MDVLVVSGFLGAGKTTFIQSLVSRHPRDYCILENEFSASRMDAAVLGQDSGLPVWELRDGCICCSIKDDFASTVLTIANVVKPSVLIVETTGVGLLSNVLSSIGQVEYDDIRLLRPVTIVDAIAFEENMRHDESVFADQIAAAGMILLSKASHLADGEKAGLEAALRSRNPSADIILDDYRSKPGDWWAQVVAPRHRTIPSSTPVVPDRAWESITLEDVHLRCPLDLLRLLEGVIHGAFGQVARGKGLISCAGRWHRFDVVGQRYSFSGFAEQPASSAVFIGTAIDRDGLERTIGSMTGTRGC